MNFFYPPLQTEQFNNAVEVMKEVSQLLVSHNEKHPDSRIRRCDLEDFFSTKEYAPTMETKEYISSQIPEDTVKMFNEAVKTVASVREHAQSMITMGKGILAAVEGNSEARRNRLFLKPLVQHIAAAEQFVQYLRSLYRNIGGSEGSAPAPTGQSVKELATNCRCNGEGIQYETESLLHDIALGAKCIVRQIRLLPFPENGKQELLDAANEHAREITPRIYGDKMTDALVKTMQGLAPHVCREGDLGADWERPTKELAAFDALRACVTLDKQKEELVAQWHANLLGWIEKRAQVAQG